MPAYNDFFGWVVFLLQKYGSMFLSGTGVTLLIAITGTIAGFGIGLLIACFRTLPEDSLHGFGKVGFKALRLVLSAYVELFRGTPMIAQAMLIFYGLAQYFNFNMDPIPAGILIVSINTGAYMTEIIRGGIISIDQGQYEGAQSIGMTHWQTMTRVVLPQAVRNIMPSIGNEFVINIKDSSVLNVISVTEMYFQAKSAGGTYLRIFEAMVIVCIIYFILTFTVTRLLHWLEKKMDGADTFAIQHSQNMSAGAVAAEVRRMRKL